MTDERSILDIAWITPVPPDRAGGGGHIRQAWLLLALSQRARVHLVSSQPVVDLAIRNAVSSLRELDLTEPGAPPTPRWIRRIRDVARAVFGREPREVHGGRTIRSKLRPLVKEINADAAIIEYAALAPLRRRLPRRTTRSILTLHNVGSVMASQQAAVEPGRRQRWLYRRDAMTARRWERRTVHRYDTVIAVSRDDAMALGSHPGLRVVRNGVDTDQLRPTELPQGARLVFTGALYTLPNRDGIAWFCREVLPLVRARHPDVTLEIVGMLPPPEISALGELPGVTVHSDVAEIAPFLEAARVAVVPLRIGSGTRLKALEAMAAGRPVVTTAIGIEGLGAIDDQHVAIADDPARFAEHISRAISDAVWAGSLVTEARRFVEETYAWHVVQREFVDVILGSVAADPVV